jgi:tetratricopeptide (TPR) repeat protein
MAMSDKHLLDMLGLRFGTDKSSAGHDYLERYDNLLAGLRHAHLNFIEIGVFNGESLATWQSYFTNATIVGIDVNPECRRFQTDRVRVMIGSQDDPGFLMHVVKEYPPTVVLDDGSHEAHHVIYTFEMLFPTVSAGGIYIVEDLHFHHGEMGDHYRGYSKINPISYFEKLATIAVHRNIEVSENWGFLGYCRTQMASVEFAYGNCIIKKMDNAAPEAWLEQIEELGRTFDDPGVWGRVAHAILARRGPLPRAKAAVTRAVELAPAEGGLYRLLSTVHSSGGSISDAIAAAIKAVELERRIGGMILAGSLEQLGDLLAQSRQDSEALAAYQEARSHADHPVIAARLDRKIATIAAPQQ